MPAAYAHYSFGKHVLKNLDEDIKNILLKNRTLYNIGLHGPDILFYYKPLESNFINKTGHDLHLQNSDVFFNNAKKVISNSSNFEATCSYIIGFICHFMLDSECHPLVRKKEKSGISHNEIETEFERFLMERDNINPLSHKPTKHIIPSNENAKYISHFFEGVTPEKVLESLKFMKFYLNLLSAPGIVKRALLITLMKITGSYNNMIGLIMKKEPNKECIDVCNDLYSAYLNAIKPTTEIINEYYRELKNSKPINNRFSRNFG